MSSNAGNRRRFRNLVNDSKFQLRFTAMFNLLTLISISLLTLFIINYVINLFNTLGIYACLGEASEGALRSDFQTIFIRVSIFVLFLIVLNFLVGLKISHSLSGPMVPIKRHIQELKAGNFSSRIHLRKGDFYQDLADELNELAKKLGEK